MSISLALTKLTAAVNGLRYAFRASGRPLCPGASILDGFSDGMIVLDPETRRVLQINPCARTMLGLATACAGEHAIDDSIEGLPPHFSEKRPEGVALPRLSCRLLPPSGPAAQGFIEWSTFRSLRRTLVLLRIIYADTKLWEARGEAVVSEEQPILPGREPVRALSSRLRLRQAFARKLAACALTHRRVGLLYVDIDNFRNINDSCGHDAGDAVLNQVARRLNQIVPFGCLVHGMGGDEFAVVTTEFDSRDTAEQLAGDLVKRLRFPVKAKGRRFIVTASIGASVFPDDARDAESLLSYADLALHHAKAEGRDQFCFFKAALREELDERLALEHALRGAVRRGEMRLEYQPIVEAKGGELIAMEALLRWEHPELGEIPPAKFIPIAESGGLLADKLGAWVVHEVCRQIRAWSDDGRDPVPVNINVSPRQFEHGGFAALTVQAARDAGIAPNLLCIEITETMLMQNLEANREELARLRNAGMRVVIDDFGTGYSSLSYLKHLPIDGLKIDRSFIRDMCKAPNDTAIVRAIVLLAESLGLATVAEGVESPEQATHLLNLGCRALQGYYFGKAQAPELCAWRLPRRTVRSALREPVGSERPELVQPLVCA